MESILNTVLKPISHAGRVLVSFSIRKFLRKALPDDLTLKVVCFPSSQLPSTHETLGHEVMNLAPGRYL